MAIHDKKEVLDAMRNRWESALVELCGWDSKTFNGNHGACPICGGVDRFRWGHKKPRQREEGFAYCSGSCGGSHDGLYWFMHARAQRFNEAINDLGDWIGGLTPEKLDNVAKASKAMAKSKQATSSNELTPEQAKKMLAAGRSQDHAYAPCYRVSQSGLESEPCNVAKISGNGAVRFGAGGRTWGAVVRIHPGTGAIYLISCPAAAARAMRGPLRESEVWIGFTPLNCREAAARYQGERELRLIAIDQDDYFLYRDCDRPIWGGDICGAFG